MRIDKRVFLPVLLLAAAGVIYALYSFGYLPQDNYAVLDGTKYSPEEYIQTIAAGKPENLWIKGKDRISALPSNIGMLTTLRTMTIEDMPLRFVPPQIGELTGLTVLKIVRTPLRDIPPEIGNLGSLTRLYLYDNNLDTLPEGVGRLAALEVLDVRNNNLRTLPAGLQSLGSLQHVYLGGNPLPEGEVERLRQQLPEAKIYK